MKRRSFLAAAAGSVVAASQPAIAASNDARQGRKALVLVGGANRGAYEAGAIHALVEQQGLRDGEPLDYDLVCGTSIGALNAALVSTAQYSLLKEIWLGTLSSTDVFRLKYPFEKIHDKDSGVLNRIDATYRLASGLVSNLKGVLDPEPVRALLARYVDPRAPVHIPTYIATTNLTRQTGAVFERRGTTPAGLRKQAANDALLANFPQRARVADDSIIQDVLFATAAIPLLFDPVEIAREDGTGFDQFVDGGVTANAPVNLAQLCAHTLNVLLVSPTRSVVDVSYANALAVGLGVFETMQARILMYQLLLAYAAHHDVFPFDPYVIQPESELPGKGTDFSDQASMTSMWQTGYADGKRGWRPFNASMRDIITNFS